jgi:hypothetical protein
MKKYFLLSFVLYILIIIQAEAEYSNSIDLIEHALKNGEIEYEQSIIYKFYVLKDSSNLPAKFYSNSPIKCGTPVFEDIVVNWSILSPKSKSIIDKYFKVEMKNGAIGFSSLSSPSIKFDTPNFTIYYDTIGVNAVFLTDKITIEILTGSLIYVPNSVPDYVEYFGYFFERSLKKILEMGYKNPASVGKINVYIENLGYYGFVPPGATHEIHVDNSYLWVINGTNPDGFDIDGDGIVSDTEKRATGGMKVTSAHELFHLVQNFGYNTYLGDITWTKGRWWKEATSTWMEDEVYDEVNDYLNYLPKWFDYSEYSLNFDSTTTTAYGSTIFCKYLTERSSGSWTPDIIKSIWEQCAVTKTALDAIDNVLKSKVTSLESEFPKFTVCNAILPYSKSDMFVDPQYRYSDDAAIQYPPIKIIKTYNDAGQNQHYISTYPARAGGEVHWEDSPGELPGLSSHYIKFLPPALLDKPSKLVLKFKAGNPGSWGHKVILVRQDNKKEVYDLTKIGGAAEGTFRFGITKSNPQPDEIKEVILVVSNLLTTPRTRGYQYSATIVPQFREVYTPTIKDGTTKTVKNISEITPVPNGGTIKLEVTLSDIGYIEADFSEVDSAPTVKDGIVKVSAYSGIKTSEGFKYVIEYKLSTKNIYRGSRTVKIKAYDLSKKEYNLDTSFKVYIEFFTQLIQLTSIGNISELSVSFDGKTIVFSRNGSLWMINRDGTGLSQILSGSDNIRYYSPSCSSSGEIVFERAIVSGIWCYDSDIYVADFYGGNMRVVADSNLPTFYFDPDGSPTDGEVVFASYNTTTSTAQIVVLDKFGQLQTIATDARSGGDGTNPQWNFNRSKIVYTNKDGKICVINQDGSGKVELTTGFFPTWTQDEQIAFIKYHQIWKINSNGSNLVSIAEIPDDCSSMDWSPDGSFAALSINGDIWLLVFDPSIITTNFKGAPTLYLNNEKISETDNTVNSTFKLGEVYCYPNPAKNGKNPTFHIECGIADNVELRIYNIAGEMIHFVNLTKNLTLENNKYVYKYSWDVSNVPSGIYIYSIKAERTNEIPIKVVKKLAIVK